MSGKNFLIGFSGFILGALGGSFAIYYIVKNKFQEQADKEIEAVRKVYEKHFNKNNDPEKKVESKIESLDKQSKTETSRYDKMYVKESAQPVETVSSISTPKKTTSKKAFAKRILTPEEFGDSEYEAETLTYYSDKILADSDGNIIHNVNDVIGPEALTTFGRYLDDTVYVRDENKKIDYEIIWDTRKYSTVHKLEGDKVPVEDFGYSS